MTIRMVLLSMMLATVGCADKDNVNFMSGMYELFFSVDVADRVCDGTLFTATLTLESSEFADTSPTEIRVLHWHFLEDVWTDIETIELEEGNAHSYQLDLADWGDCNTLGSSVVFVPRSSRAYGDPRFIALETGLANGASSSYSFETQTNTVKFFCPQDQTDEAEAIVYNFKKRQMKSVTSLSQRTENDEGLTGGDGWSGTTQSLSPERDVVILLGKKDGNLACSFLL